MKSKVVLEAECDFQDTELRDAFNSISKKLDRVNDRTKRQTIQIRELEKRIKLMEVKHGRRLQT